jgi:hypothetical protein
MMKKKISNQRRKRHITLQAEEDNMAGCTAIHREVKTQVSLRWPQQDST